MHVKLNFDDNADGRTHVGTGACSMNNSQFSRLHYFLTYLIPTGSMDGQHMYYTLNQRCISSPRNWYSIRI